MHAFKQLMITSNGYFKQHFTKISFFPVFYRAVLNQKKYEPKIRKFPHLKVSRVTRWMPLKKTYFFFIENEKQKYHTENLIEKNREKKEKRYP